MGRKIYKYHTKVAFVFFHMVSYLQKFGRLCHMSEDPIERTHKEDKNLGRTFSHIRDPTLREEAKKKVCQMKSHGTIANLV